MKRKRIKLKNPIKFKKPKKQKLLEKQIENRKKQRKNYFPAIIVTILLWISVAFTLYFVDPNTFAAIPFFLFQLFLALLFTFSLILANTRRGVLVSFGTILFLTLRFLGVGNILNFLLIFALIISIEFYFYTVNST